MVPSVIGYNSVSPARDSDVADNDKAPERGVQKELLFWEKKRRESTCPHPSITEQRTPSGKSTYTCSLCHMKADNLAAFGR